MDSIAKLGITLQESTKKVERLIAKALVTEVDKAVTKAVKRAVPELKKGIGAIIQATDTYQSLNGGQLAAEFGLPDGKNRIDRIIEVLSDSVKINKKKVFARGGKIQANISVMLVQRDYENILRLPEASVITSKGQRLPWLEWLLKFGDTTIIRDYEIDFTPSRLKRSRTGFAVMTRVKGGRWRVPPQFSGTVENNFITRALNQFDKAFKTILFTELNKAFS